MEQHIKVTGMTCLNCQKSVTEKLEALEGVGAVSVLFEEARAQFETATPLPLERIATQLGSKYSVSALDPAKKNALAAPKTISKWQQLTPLWLIFGYLIAATWFLQQLRQAPEVAMYDFMGLFFIVFSFFKFLDYKGFPDSFAQYDPLAKKSRGYAFVYPFLESALGVMFLLQIEVFYALGATLIILSITTLGVLQSLMQKNQIQCACLGTALKLPMTEATLIENLLMITMAIVGLSGYWL
jgi:copper chaperone CopZ